MADWNTELQHHGERVADVKIRKGISEGDSLSRLLFITTRIPRPKILREVVQGYKFQQGRKVNHLIFMNDLKFFERTKGKLESLVNTVKNTHRRLEDEIWTPKVCHINNETWQKS